MCTKLLVMKTIDTQKKTPELKLENIDCLPSKNGYVDKEGIYQLSDFQLEKLRVSNEQIERGEYFTQDEMDESVAQWLKEK